MIRSLRNNFIRVMLLSLLIVMILLIAVINIVYLVNIRKQAYETIDFVEEHYVELQSDGVPVGPPGTTAPNALDDGGPGAVNEGQWNDDIEDWNKSQSAGGFFNSNPADGSHLTPDTKFETSFFTVTLNEDGSISDIGNGNIASVTEDDIRNYAEEILQSENATGRADYFLYKIFDEDNNTRKIVAVSCYQQLRQSRLLFLICVLAGLLYMAAVFTLVWFMSRRITRPVEESIQKQRQFITDAGHELKTPITIIKANTEVLQMENGSNQWTDSIKNQTKRLSSLVQSLLELSKLNEKDVTDVSEEFNLSKTIHDAAESFRVPIESCGKALETSIEDGIRFKGSRDELYRLITLLMDNALKYSNDAEPIQVSLTKHHHTILTVYNTCDYIDKEKVDRLFERFYRADESRSRKTGGSGIGLSVAQAIVERHKGTISASSEDGTSIKFTAVF